MKKQKGLYRYPQAENIMSHVELQEPMVICQFTGTSNSNTNTNTSGKNKNNSKDGRDRMNGSHKPSIKHTGSQIFNKDHNTWSCCNRALNTPGCTDDTSVNAKDELVAFPEDAYKPYKMHKLYNHLKTCVYQERHDNTPLPQVNNKGYRDIPDPFNLQVDGPKKVIYNTDSMTSLEEMFKSKGVSTLIKHLHHHGDYDDNPDLYHDLPEHLGGPVPKASKYNHHGLIAGSGLDGQSHSVSSQEKEEKTKKTQVMSKSKLRLLQLSRSIKTLNQSTLVDDDPYEMLTDTMFENHVDLRHTLNNSNITSIARTAIATPGSLVAALGYDRRVPYNTVQPKTMIYSHVEADNIIQRRPSTAGTRTLPKRPQSSTGHVNRPTTHSNSRRPSSALPNTSTTTKTPSLTSLPKKTLYRPKSGNIGQLRECKNKDINIDRKQGRPLTAQSGPHLYTTSTITPAQCINNINARII